MPPTLWPSDVTWQLFMIATEEENTSSSKLHLIVRHSVKNELTRTVIWQALREPAIFPLQVDVLGVSPLEEGLFAQEPFSS